MTTANCVDLLNSRVGVGKWKRQLKFTREDGLIERVYSARLDGEWHQYRVLEGPDGQLTHEFIPPPPTLPSGTIINL